MPDLIGKYRIDAVLGSGATGTVYDAWDPDFERRVAIKSIRLPAPGEPDAQAERERLRREPRAAGKLAHPNIVPAFDYLEADGQACIVMEFQAGGDLRRLLGADRALPLPECARLMRQLVAGLAYSHGQGIVHRDIKPANLLLSADGTLKIGDFGLARIDGSRHTATGVTQGTPHFMAPEQWRGERAIGPAADIYSSGVVLYRMLTGRFPFVGDTQYAIMHAALFGTFDPPHKRLPGLPRALDAVVVKAMAREAGDRYASAAAFGAALEAALREDPEATVVTRADAGPRRGRVGWVVAGTAALAAVVGVGAHFGKGDRPPATQAAAGLEATPGPTGNAPAPVPSVPTLAAPSKVGPLPVPPAPAPGGGAAAVEAPQASANMPVPPPAVATDSSKVPKAEPVDQASAPNSGSVENTPVKLRQMTQQTEPRAGSVIRDCPTCPDMVLIPAGSFTMGIPAAESQREPGWTKDRDWDAQPPHEVQIRQAFYMGKTHVTRGQYAAFAKATGRAVEKPPFDQTDGHPVVNVSWDDAQAYATWLSLQAGTPYRLPTEAEWEYAARAGTQTARYWGDSATQQCDYANGFDLSFNPNGKMPDMVQCRDNFVYTSPVGSFRPNAFGLHDMLGNALQWVQDCYEREFSKLPRNGSSYETNACSSRVARGGSFGHSPGDLRTGIRVSGIPAERLYFRGFRVARTFTP